MAGIPTIKSDLTGTVTYRAQVRVKGPTIVTRSPVSSEMASFIRFYVALPRVAPFQNQILGGIWSP